MLKTSYNAIAGQSGEPFAAPIDGISALAATLLLLDSHVIAREIIRGPGA